MTNLNEKQKLLRDQIIKRLGFRQDNFLEEYQDILEKVSNSFRLLGVRTKIWNEQQGQFKPFNENVYHSYQEKGDFYIPNSFSILDFLIYEINFKKNKHVRVKTISNTYISATDISNYTFCPISYSINKTFEIPRLESSTTGKFMHERNILLYYVKPYKLTDSNNEVVLELEFYDSFNEFINFMTKNFFDDVKKAQLFYCGHSDGFESKKFFKNKKDNYVGQPDYIFFDKSKQQYFVVEEKFQYVKKDEQGRYGSHIFYPNHVNQLNSYIHGLDNLNITHGYLLYWKYCIEGNESKVISCDVLRIEKTAEGRKSFIEVFQKVSQTIKNRGGQFEINMRNPNKCASCVSSFVCGHKTGMYDKFTIPYSVNYLKVFDITECDY